MHRYLKPSMIFFILAVGIFGHQQGFAREEVQFIREIKGPLVQPVDIAVADTGEIYVLDQQRARVSVFDTHGDFRQDFDEPAEHSARLREPRSLAFSPRGRIAVADFGNNQIRVFGKNGKFLFKFGSMGILPGQFRGPAAVAMDSFGFIFVADAENRRIQVFSPHGIFLNEFPTDTRPSDLGVDFQRNLYVLLPDISKLIKYSPEGKKLQEMSCRMEQQNLLEQAQAVAVDQRGDIYITDRKGQSVKKFDEQERVLIAFGSQGHARGQFQGIFGVTADDQGRIFIADSLNQRVQIFKVSGSSKEVLAPVKNSPLVLDFDSTMEAMPHVIDIYSVPGKGLYLLSDTTSQVIIKGRKQNIFGKQGSRPGEFLSPKAIHVALNGQIFVADTGMDRIQFLKDSGEPSYDFGTAGDHPSEFRHPEGIVVNDKGEIYVADTLNRRIQVFNFDGIYLNSFGFRRANQKAPTDAELRCPGAVALDAKGRVYVVDKELNRIQIYSPDGDYWGSIGEKGSDKGQFNKPVDVAIDENNNIYVADQGNYRIQIFDNRGKFLLSFGSPGKGWGYFEEISALAVSEGLIYVADYLSDTIQVFRFAPEGLDSADRLYATRTSTPENQEKNILARFHLAKNAAFDEGIKELALNSGLSPDKVKELVKIESVTSLNNGQIKVTVSIPKNEKK